VPRSAWLNDEGYNTRYRNIDFKFAAKMGGGKTHVAARQRSRSKRCALRAARCATELASAAQPQPLRLLVTRTRSCVHGWGTQWTDTPTKKKSVLGPGRTGARPKCPQTSAGRRDRNTQRYRRATEIMA